MSFLQCIIKFYLKERTLYPPYQQKEQSNTVCVVSLLNLADPTKFHNYCQMTMSAVFLILIEIKLKFSSRIPTRGKL